MKRLLDTRSHSWREAGLARRLSSRAVKRARIQTLVLLPMIAGVLVLYSNRQRIFGVDEPVRIATVFALVALGWQFARDLGRAAGPTLFRRMDPGTAGHGRLPRAVLHHHRRGAGRAAGRRPGSRARSPSAARSRRSSSASPPSRRFGNLFAGLVLLSARPFRVGDRVRLQGGGLAGEIEGVVARSACSTRPSPTARTRSWSPTASCSTVAVIPLHEPAGVDLRARLRPGVTPGRHRDAAARADRDADARQAARRARGDRRRRARRPDRASPREPGRRAPRLASEVLRRARRRDTARRGGRRARGPRRASACRACRRRGPRRSCRRRAAGDSLADIAGASCANAVSAAHRRPARRRSRRGCGVDRARRRRRRPPRACWCPTPLGSCAPDSCEHARRRG